MTSACDPTPLTLEQDAFYNITAALADVATAADTILSTMGSMVDLANNVSYVLDNTDVAVQEEVR